MTIRELRDNRNKLLTDAQAILLASPDAEKRASANQMLADADLIEADIKSLEKIESVQTEERSRTAPARPIPGAVENEAKSETETEKRAFQRYIQFGETRTGVTTSSGAQLVPQAFYPVLTEAMKSYGSILNFVKQIDTDNGAPMKYATANDTGNLISVVGENTAVSETDPTISGSTISSDFLTTNAVQVSLAELQDSAFDLDAFIKDIFGKRYFRGLASMVTSGNGSNISSLVTGATLGATVAAPTATMVWADVVNLFAALDPAYETDAVFSMNSTTRGALLAITDTLGRPLYVPAPSANAFDMILGKRVVINPYQDAPTQGVADRFPVLYGDMSNYLLRNVKPGLEIRRLNERYMDAGAVGFIGFARAGGALLDAGTHPVLKLKIAHS
jgi:HK97 family phage major capsid protein